MKTGEDNDDTFVKMLQQVVRITLPVAHGIVSRYPHVVSLVEAFRKEGPSVLEDLKVSWTRSLLTFLLHANHTQKCSNKDGSFSDSRIGPAISKKLYKVFMETDPMVMDI